MYELQKARDCRSPRKQASYAMPHASSLLSLSHIHLMQAEPILGESG